ncbi:hypothetical protein Mp_1g04160 [Marchantia polymorpha subsp. ruderalis]|uniref:MalT-like TPR region domain-containing protein n=4 Tax=Marchantia polymorpha TaxID=3197 RepID=A0AAF6ALC5_MARPO|nr:hypothetical protein MARPO_0005s0191 [Marchantia polymorpha]BBM97245.1 hypothetical protein Mp_1g04160 [Marchantia polymorpha subsp. ruderalis]|eukprot:PTQ48561.1 hypothetical protein MARPO_0005s0191 [Marchantia polymorpha]
MENDTDGMIMMKEPIARLQNVEDAAVQAMDLGDLDRCLFLRMQALALAKLCRDDPTVQDKEIILAKAHLQLSATYLEMGYGDQAYWHASRAMEAGDPRRGSQGEPINSSLLVAVLLALARSMLMRADTRCESYLRRALQINTEITDDNDPSNAPIHEAIGDLFVFAKDSGVPMIENDTKRSHKKRAKSPKSPSSPGAIGAPDEVQQDFYDRGMASYDKAWDLINNSVGGKIKKSGKKSTKHPSLAQIYSKIAKTKVKQGKDEEAADMFERAIASHGLATVPNICAVAHLNFELGCVYHRLQKYDESLSALEKSNKFCEQQRDLGRTDPLSLMIMKEKGCCMYDRAEYESAKSTFEELLQFQRKEYGGGSIMVAETLKYLGDCSVGLQNMEEATHRYTRAVRIMKRKYGIHDPNVRELVAYIRELNLQEEYERQIGEEKCMKNQEIRQPETPMNRLDQLHDIPESPDVRKLHQTRKSVAFWIEDNAA